MKAICPHCGGHYEVDEPGEYACPSCAQAFEVKAPAPPKAPPRQVTLKVSHNKASLHEKREDAPAATPPPAAKPRLKIKLGDRTAQTQTETTHTCPWCMTKIPGTRTYDTWACPACTRLYIVKDGTRTERVYRTFSNPDTGIPRKTLVIGTVLILIFSVIFIIAIAITLLNEI